MRRKVFVIVMLGLLGWGLCGATMGIGMALFSIETALIIHAMAAPVFFSMISIYYNRKFRHTSPLQTAVIFLGIVIIMDAGLVAPVMVGSYEMFTSLMGTWIPFLLIFLATYITSIVTATRSSA